MGIGPTFQLNPLVTASYVYLYTDAGIDRAPKVGRGDIIDNNGNGVLDLGDAAGFGGFYNPLTRGVVSNNGVDPNLDAPTTDELLFSVEHALLPEFVVGLNLTYRRITDILESELLVFDCGVGNEGCAFDADHINSIGRLNRRDDYVRVVNTPAVPAGAPRLTPNGEPYDLVWYELRPGVESRGGTFLENGDREQEYVGASLTFNKRLANRWMLRGNFSWSDWEWSEVPESELEDPTPFLGEGFEGEPVLQGSGLGSGPKGAVYINSAWSYSLNGLYQIAPDRPWGFNAALSLTGREGYPLPYFERLNPGVRDGIPGFTFVQVVENEEIRLDDIHILDARVEKEFTFSDFGLTLGVDVFNVMNQNYVQQRAHRLRAGPSATNPLAPASDFITETTSPRIFRLGARFSFR